MEEDTTTANYIKSGPYEYQGWHRVLHWYNYHLI